MQSSLLPFRPSANFSTEDFPVHRHTPESMRSPYFPARTVLFRKEQSGVTYRIPGLLFLSRSRCFLAFCEERLSPSDSEAHLLVMRKGTFYRNYVEVSVFTHPGLVIKEILAFQMEILFVPTEADRVCKSVRISIFFLPI